MNRVQTVKDLLRDWFGSDSVHTASIGGSGTGSMHFPEELPFFKEDMIAGTVQGIVTPFGVVPQIKLMRINNQPVIRVPLHGWERLEQHGVCATIDHTLATFWLLYQLGVKQVIVDASAGGVQADPWDVVIPNDIYVYEAAKIRVADLCRELGQTPWIRMAEPFCPRLRRALVNAFQSLPPEYRGKTKAIHDGGKYWTTPLGPFETPYEVEYLHRNGATLVGQSSGQEALAARVTGICIAVANPIANYAEGRESGLWNSDGMREYYDQCALPTGIATFLAIQAVLGQERTCQCAIYGKGEGLSMLANDLP